MSFISKFHPLSSGKEEVFFEPHLAGQFSNSKPVKRG